MRHGGAARARSAISPGVRWTAWTAISRSVDQTQRSEPLQRAHAVLRDAVADLVRGLVHVHVDRQIELRRERRDLLEGRGR